MGVGTGIPNLPRTFASRLLSGKVTVTADAMLTDKPGWLVDYLGVEEATS